MSRPIFACGFRFRIERYGEHWGVHDAHAITDAEIREGKRAPVVATFSSLDAAQRYCEGQE